MRHLRILVLTLVPAVPAAAQPVPCTTGLAPGSTLAGELGAAPGGSFTELACLEIRSDQAFERREVAVSGVPLPAALRLTDARLLTLEITEGSLGAADPAVDATLLALRAAGVRLSIDDFMKIQLRVAKVLAAEKVPNSRKLMKIQVDLGTEQRTIVAGIAEAYEPEQLVGRSIAVLANLKPAKLMGIESNGMLLAASPDGGKPELVTFDNPPAPGTRIR